MAELVRLRSHASLFLRWRVPKIERALIQISPPETLPFPTPRRITDENLRPVIRPASDCVGYNEHRCSRRLVEGVSPPDCVAVHRSECGPSRAASLAQRRHLH